MTSLRIGIIGLGNMGSVHARNILAGKIPRLQLTAVADAAPARLEAFPEVARFATPDELIASDTVDAVLIATPHFSHRDLGIASIRAGRHVLVEKPISVHKADCELLLREPRRPGQIVGAMFNQRTNPAMQKIRQLIRTGELGAVRRIQWTITNWFRSEAYYRSGGWRATWRGEGGGVLLNQCPHQLDLWWWLFGQPARVRAFCHFGKYHAIEVEDEVTAYLEYADGATGVFISSTGEAPGTNRLEIAAEQGRVILENGHLTFTRNEEQTSVFSRRTDQAFATPPVWDVTVPVSGEGGQHNEILDNYTKAVLDGAPLLAPADEGVHSVELANAMLLSTWTDRTVSLPLDPVEYSGWLQQKQAKSRQKPDSPGAAPAPVSDFQKSFSR
jgi:predicted dehydrogenase